MNIAILGYGVEGESIFNYYHAKYPSASFAVYDNNEKPKNPLPGGVRFIGGVADFKGIEADIAVKTPSIPPWEVEVTGEVTTMTREFLRECSAPVIGVTGTKGKGTTSSLIKSILEAAGKKVWLVGNIGIGAFDVLGQIQPEDVVVYELSSFQLWELDVSPHIAVVLGIEPEHLDVHKDLADYVSAKANIAKHQKPEDSLIYKIGNEYVESIADQSAAAKIPYPSNAAAHVSGGMFYYGEQQLCSVEVMKIPGVHNQDNACAAIAAAWPWVHNGETIATGLAAFEGLPHRLKFVRELDNVKYYDDSIATTPGSAIAALAAFAEPKILIVGGSYKGATYEHLAAEIVKTNMRYVYIIGDEAPKIQEALEATGMSDYLNLGTLVTMGEIVEAAKAMARPGDVVILSPACASFGMFKNYSDRGEQFIQAVQNL